MEDQHLRQQEEADGGDRQDPSGSSGDKQVEPKEGKTEEQGEDARIVAAIARGVDITEVFSPNRLAKACIRFGLIPGGSMDLSTGWNFDLVADRRRAVGRVKSRNRLSS